MPVSDAEQIDAWQRELERTGRVELRTSRARLLRILLGSVALTAAAAFLALTDSTDRDDPLEPTSIVHAVGWVGVAFFGLAVVVVIWRLISGGSTIIVTREQVEQLGGFRIAWADVAAVLLVRVRNTRSQTVAVIRARDAATQRRALTARRSIPLLGLANAVSGGPDLGLPNDLAGDRAALVRWLGTLVPAR